MERPVFTPTNRAVFKPKKRPVPLQEAEPYAVQTRTASEYTQTIQAPRVVVMPHFGDSPQGGHTMYTPHYDHVCFKLRLLGHNNEQICMILGVSNDTITTWRRLYPTFKKAWFDGRDLADSEVAYGLFQRALGYSHPETKLFKMEDDIKAVDVVKHYPPDTSAGIFWLSNRNRWRWKNSNTTEVTGPNGTPLTPPPALRITFVTPDNVKAETGDKTIEGKAE